MEDFTFIPNPDGYTLTKYTGTSGKIVIPNFYNDKLVTAIKPTAFFKPLIIVEIVLPDSLKIIEEYTFSNLLALRKIVFNEGLEVIGENAFLSCYSLEEVILPSSLVEVKANAFNHCSSLTKVRFLNSSFCIKNFENTNYFYRCNKLVEIDFLAWNLLSTKQLFNVITHQFTNFDQLNFDEQELIFTFIRNKFNDCFCELKDKLFTSNNIELINFLLSKNLQLDLDDIDKYLLHSTTQKDTTFSAILLDYKDKNFSKEEVNIFNENKELSMLNQRPPTLKQFGLTWDYIPHESMEYGVCVTDYFGSQRYEVIPEFLVDLQGEISNVIVSIDFLSTKNFQSIEILDIQAKINVLNFRIFNDFFSLKKIILPNSLKLIDSKAFGNCHNIVEIVIPDGVTDIRSGAFYNCTSLKKVVLPDTLINLAKDSFMLCDSLTDVVFPDGENDFSLDL